MTSALLTEIDKSSFAWRPAEIVRREARLTAFLKHCGLTGVDELHAHSIQDVGRFTEEVLDFLDIRFSPPYAKILDVSDGLPWAKWCENGGLNISWRCLDYHNEKGVGDRKALIWEGEGGEERSLTYGELLSETETCAAGLRCLGLSQGDRVAIHLPMLPETLIAMLAVARIGAIAVPLFSGYGSEAIRTRLASVNAKCLVTCDGFHRRGRLIDAKAVAAKAVASVPCVEHVVVVSRSGGVKQQKLYGELSWEELMVRGDEERFTDKTSGVATPTRAEDSLLILYTSGTTGNPKGIVHTHCGFPVKAAQDMCFGTDVGEGTRICWITDIGWMMGPWLIYGALILGATLTLYDGAPDFPDAGRLWAFCEKHWVEVLGISPSLIRALAPHGSQLSGQHDLSSLRILASTGESWDETSWWWLFENVGRGRLPIINYSGGTEISGGILMGNPLEPQRPCAFSAVCPGMDVDIVDEGGESIESGIGELVIRQPWIGMARGFHGDPERYLETYWSRWPHLWVHGDWASRDSDGQWFIHGRSDDTIKVAGKRVGPSEIETALLSHPAVLEAAAIDVPDELKGNHIVAFCVVDTNSDPETLAALLRESVGEQLGKPLRPQRVLFVAALPKTRNAKIMRRVIRAIYLGLDPGDLSALDNQPSLDAIRDVALHTNHHREGV